MDNDRIPELVNEGATIFFFFSALRDGDAAIQKFQAANRKKITG